MDYIKFFHVTSEKGFTIYGVQKIKTTKENKMNNEKLDHVIELHDEILVLDDILEAAENQPYLEFLFSTPSGINEHTYTVKNEALVHQILCDITQRKMKLEAEFEAL